MTSPVTINGVHHVTLTVSDVARSVAFYTTHFGLEKLAEFGDRVALLAGGSLLVLTPPPDPSQAISDDQFNENRIGLDHLSLTVGSRDDLVAAADYFDAQGVSRGEIKDLGEGFAIYVMAVRDPDNIQMELTAPY